MIDAFSDRLTSLIIKNLPDIDVKKAEIINFGLKSLMSEIIKLTIVLTTAYFLGIFNLIIIAIVGYSTLRTSAGGFHANSHLGCLLTSSAILFGSVYISQFMSAHFSKLNVFYMLVYIFVCLMIYFYAPADVAEKPIISKKLRKRLKTKSFYMFNLLFIFTLVFVHEKTISCIIIMALFFESLTLTPVCYRIMNCKHGCEGDI